MEKKFKLGVIGAGFMGRSIIDGVVSSGILSANDIICSDISDNVYTLKDKGINTTNDNYYLVNNSEFVLFAVKPQNISDVLTGIEGASCKKFISIMAGVKKQKIKDVFPKSSVARCMPNTPCSISCGAVGLDVSDFDDADRKFIKNLFTSIARVTCVPEDKMNVVTGVSGSSPAYFYMFLKGIIEAGVRRGLSQDESKELAASTMKGSAEMVLKSDKNIDELINAVCSKGGTTIQAVKVFEENDLNGITEKAIDACVKRSIELENL